MSWGLNIYGHVQIGCSSPPLVQSWNFFSFVNLFKHTFSPVILWKKGVNLEQIATKSFLTVSGAEKRAL